MRTKWLSLTMAAVLSVTVFAGCGSAVNKKENLPEKLVFTYVTAPLNVPTIVEEEKDVFEDTFEKLGIDVEYAELTSGADQTQALASGDVQVLYGAGASSVILSAANGADIKILNMYSRSPKAFCLYAKDEKITSAEDLRGKTIAGPAGTNLHELLVAYLAEANMSIEDVNYVNMSIPEAKAALDGGSIDAALLAGAAAYQAGQQGHVMVTDGEGLIDAIIAVAVTEDFYQKYPEIIRALTAAQEEILSFIQNHEAEALEMTADELDLEISAVEEMFAFYDFSMDITEADKQGLQKTADFMFENGMIDNRLDIIELLFTEKQ